MNTLEAWAYLNRVTEGPSRALQKQLQAGRDAEEIAVGVQTRASWLGDLAADTAARYDWVRAEEDLAAAEAVGARLITPEHAEWPAEAFSHAFGFAETGISDHIRTYQADAVAPHGLWAKGGAVNEAVAQSVGVIGTRGVSSYGIAATRMLVKGLAAHQWTIVSGGALGVDAAAHNAALDAQARTMVVAACGIDRDYPSKNVGTFRNIVATGGTIISEYPPGTTPQRHRFLTRNRLVAALTQGTVVVEAAWRSGALNTLSWAEGLGRVAMAVPGPITGTGSLGCHQRLREGRAQLVTSADDIRSLLGAVGAVDVEKQYELAFAPSEIQGLSRNELRVYDALAPAQATETDAVAATAGLPLPLTVHLLVDLARRGVVAREGTGWCRERAED